MDDIKLALLGDRKAATRLTNRGKMIPCPGCGEAQAGLSPGYSVRCWSCGWRGPAQETKRDAILEWNTRATLLSQEELDMLEKEAGQ